MTMILSYFPRHCIGKSPKTVTTAFKWITNGWPFRDSFQLLQAIFDKMIAQVDSNDNGNDNIKGEKERKRKVATETRTGVGMEWGNLEFWQEFYWPCQQYLQSIKTFTK